MCTIGTSSHCIQQDKGRVHVVLCALTPGEGVLLNGVASGHAEGKQEHHRQHKRRAASSRREGDRRRGGGSGDGRGTVSLLLALGVVVCDFAICGFAMCSFDFCGFAACGFAACGVAVGVVVALLAVVDVVGLFAVVALLDHIGLVGIVILAAALVCRRIHTRVLGWGIDAGEVLLVVLLDGLQGVALEALRHPLLDLLLLGLAPRLELVLGLAIRGAHGRRRRRRRLGLARNARVVLAVLLLDGGLCEVLVGLRRVLVNAPEGLLAPRLQLLRGVAICGGCWR
mmetsp:Transcript_174043/g.552538  ORF Transcript_174043/g.552538 Transcript_174043/m.552538 type:complete len:284 (-) Transcript_174043:147-998(-)